MHQILRLDCHGSYASSSGLDGLLAARLADDRVVALGLELLDQLRAARLDDPPVDQHVDELGLDVVQEALVVGDEQHAHLRALWIALTPSATIRSASMSRPESVSSMIGDLRLEHRHLQHLGALLLAAGEALVHVARGERLVHLQQLHLLDVSSLAELASASCSVPRTARVAAAQEVAQADARDRDRVLEGQEEARLGALVRGQRQDVLALEAGRCPW